MLRWRLLLGGALVGVLAWLCWLEVHAPLPGMWLFLPGMFCMLLATDEVLYLGARVGGKPLAWTIYLSNTLLMISSWVPLVWERAAEVVPDQATGTWPMLALALSVLLVFGGEMYRFQKPGGAAVNVAMGVFAIVYVGLLFGLLAQLLVRWGIWALASVVIVTKAGDVGAYTVGRLVGRHKLAPRLSPGKTVEGAIGALTFGCLTAWLTFGLLMPLASGQPATTSWWGWLPFGLLVATAGMIGDLAESLMKRDADRKDSSSWLPGFGGVLDIVDSILLAAPVGWFCWAVGLVGA
jgi:phosphatidate cytidylyltransferase